MEPSRDKGHHRRGTVATENPYLELWTLTILFLVQLPHNPVGTIPRGGGYTADHVDVLGSTPLSEIVLKVATGAADEVQETFVSDIQRYAKRIQWD